MKYVLMTKGQGDSFVAFNQFFDSFSSKDIDNDEGQVRAKLFPLFLEHILFNPDTTKSAVQSINNNLQHDKKMIPFLIDILRNVNKRLNAHSIAYTSFREGYLIFLKLFRDLLGSGQYEDYHKQIAEVLKESDDSFIKNYAPKRNESPVDNKNQIEISKTSAPVLANATLVPDLFKRIKDLGSIFMKISCSMPLTEDELSIFKETMPHLATNLLLQHRTQLEKDWEVIKANIVLTGADGFL